MTSQEDMSFDTVKVHVLNKVFNTNEMKKRVNMYVDDVYCNTNDNRKIRKAFRNQLLDTIKKENEIIKTNLRLVENKKPTRKRKKREYTPTDYVLFCREMRKQHPSSELSGQMHKLWREKRGLNKKQEPVKQEEVKERCTAEEEKQRYKRQIEEMGLFYMSDSDTESD